MPVCHMNCYRMEMVLRSHNLSLHITSSARLKCNVFQIQITRHNYGVNDDLGLGLFLRALVLLSLACG